jgi:ligand-binding SRPBCC domain-containing protein
MSFKILTDLGDQEVFEGMLIDYIVRPILGIPLPWQTEIFKVNKPNSFSDRQLKGPYKIWEHTHSFIQMENGVLVKDDVKYELPLGILGDIAHAVFVKKKVESIFKFREQALNRIFLKLESKPK